MYQRANLSTEISRFLIEPLEGRLLLSGVLAVTYATSGSDPSGLATLSYDNVQLINEANHGGFQVNRYYTLNSDGQTYTAVYGGTGFTPSWNPGTDTLTYTYAWGTMTCQYVLASSSQFNMDFTVSNSANSGVTLGGIDIYPAAITFPHALVPSNETQIVDNPSPPAPAYYTIITYGSDGPAVLPADYSGGSSSGDVMAMVNTSPVTKQMYTALWTFGDVNTNHDYYMIMGTGPKDSMLPPPLYSTTPLIYTNTPPGSSDSFSVSLRFAPKSTTSDPMTLGSDIESAYATQYPDIVNWPDRRPIASLHITSPPLYPTLNPEGWNNDADTDFTSGQAALSNFAAWLLSDAASTVTQMQNDNAQGVIVWDLEGQRWPQATTYIGDPSLATSLYPNLTDDIEQPVTLNNGTVTTPMAYNYNGAGPLIDQFFAVFRDAGFRTGMTIRPTVITFNGPDGNPQQSSPTSPATEVSVLEAKIQYALSTWGCTLFYLDSNTGFDRDALAQVQAAYPNVLIIPEHSYTSVYASTAPYGQLLTYDFVGTPADVRLTYPNAFSVIYPANGDNNQSNMPDYYAPMEANVALGDIILFRGWYADPYNTTMVQMYDQAVPSLPATPNGLKATAGTNLINLSWNAVTGTGIYGTGVYNVKRSTSSNGTYTTIAYNVFGTSYTDTSAVNGTAYYYEVAAINGRGQGSNSSPSMSATTSTGAPPTVFSGAHAVNFNGSTANLSVMGADTAAETMLTYTWACTTTPPNLSQPTYSVNGTNAAKYATVTFYQLGTYLFTVTIKDGNNLTTTSSGTVVVNQFTHTLTIAPANDIVAGGTNTTYTTPTGTDQFGGTIVSPFATWSASGSANAAINYSTGVFTSNQSAGSYTIYANFGSVQSSTGVIVVPDVFSGSPGGDSYSLSINPSNTTQDQLVVSISGSGTVTYYIPTLNLPSLTINPSTGNDTLTISFANGNPLPASGVTFSGGANVSGNAIYVQGVASGGLSFSLNAASFTDTASPSSPISYTGVGKLEFDLSGGANSLTQLTNPVPALTYNAGSGSNTLNVSGGIYSFSTDPQIADGSLTVNDNSSVILAAAATGSGFNARHLAALNIGPGATAIAQSQGTTDQVDPSVLVLGEMSISTTGQLDLGDNDLILHSSATNRAADLTRANGYLETGFNGGQWNGLGMTSTAANSSAGHLTALGLILNDDGSNPGGVGNPLYASFDSQTAVATDLLVTYTYYGDSTLDGKVDGSDYSRTDSGYLSGATGWQNGDFNYDGVINGSDYTLIDDAFNSQGAKLTANILAGESTKPAQRVGLAAPVDQGSESIAGASSTGTSNTTIDDLLDGWEDQSKFSRLIPLD